MSCDYCDGTGTVRVSPHHGNAPFVAVYADCPEGCPRPAFKGMPCTLCGQPSGRRAPTPLCASHRVSFNRSELYRRCVDGELEVKDALGQWMEAEARKLGEAAMREAALVLLVEEQ